MRISFLRLLVWLIVGLSIPLVAGPSHAFNPEEHKIVGDLGSQRAAEMIKDAIPAPRLVKFNHDPKEVRLVVKGRFPKDLKGSKDSRFDKSFVPRERAHEAKTPLLIWVGAADQTTGEWFTFGDLVSLYGDFRRIITCDAKPGNSDCRLTDPPRPMTRNYNPAKFTKARYKAMKDLAQGWNFWDDSPQCKYGAIALTNNGVIEGKNTQSAWCDEFFKIAKGNHWHFGPTALKWYVAMHRQAFFLMAQAAATKDKAKRQRFIWKALHYEGHALHSLTDLFAPGHVMVERYVTTNKILKKSRAREPFPSWQAEIWKTTFANGAPNAQLLKKPSFRGIKRITQNDLNVLTGPTDTVTARQARYEANFHDGFNAAGADVRNLKGGSTSPRFVSPRQHSELPQIWRAFGDGSLYAYEGERRLNPGQGEWAAAAVEDSIRSLFDGYQAILKGGDPAQLSMAPALFDALADLPIEMRNICVDDKGNCFAPDQRNGTRADFRWVSYAPLVLKLLGLKPLPDAHARLLPSCTGESAISGPSSTVGYSSNIRKFFKYVKKKVSRQRTEGCEKAWDKGQSSRTEMLKAKKGSK